jgi:site-specific DNA-adenine methylase
MRTATPSSPADAALHRVEAFLRVAHDGSREAGTQPPSAGSPGSRAPGTSDERQMVLPHVQLDARTGAVTPESVAAAEGTAVEKTIWGSPAGKKHLAPRLVKLIPPHTTYVEPFAGSGAVFFAKPPSEKEVLGDADPEIAFAYKVLARLTDAELAALKKKDWTGRKTLYRAMQEAKPKSKIEKLYRFLYLSHFAYGKLRGKSYNPNAEGIAARTIDRIEKYRCRLRNVTVRSAHYADVVKEFDGKDTFFFLDPPYPGHNVEVGEDRFDEAEFRKVLDGIKGKFLVTYGTRGELDTTGFHVRTIRTRRTISSMRGVGGPKTLPQLLIANYAITQKSLDPYELEVIEAAVELTPDAAADLDLARVLAKAIAEATDTPSVRALVDELDRFEDITGSGVVVLARELLPVGERLATAIDGELPELAGMLHDAQPELDDLAKAQWTRAYVNDLPDDAFLYIEPGGTKDDTGKTVPRSLRHFPFRDRNGDVDVPHLRNAIARIPQSDAAGLTADKKDELQGRARRLLEEAQDTVEKARMIPFQQWGGSSKYARKLADRLPEHKRYVEPFCGAAAVFYAKAAADEEILADADPDVAFAHRFLQKLDDRSMAALRKLPWKVSRAGFAKVRSCEPRSDAQRFWKVAYSRLCTYGAKPNLSGYASIHDGQTYDLEELWKFHKRLQGVKILAQDWQKTLADCDGPDTLFFIDPPYDGEWTLGEGIPAEEVAAAVRKLKGQYIVAYTDSAEARRAFAKAGRPFKLRIPEKRGTGHWQKRNRLFVASSALRKSDDVDWLELDDAAAPAPPALLSVLEKRIPLLKTDEERYVLGVVLEPETVDAQDDIYSAAEVRDAAHGFMEQYQNIGLMHRGLVNGHVKILESYLAPTAFSLDGAQVRKGTWLLAVRVLDDELWAQIKSGDLTGLSIGGSASRVAAR